MSRTRWLFAAGLAVLAAAATAASGQTRPYIGYVYPAGGQQGTTFQIRLGGQNLDDVNGVLVSGTGVQATVAEYFKRLGTQDSSLLREQLSELHKAARDEAAKSKSAAATEKPQPMMMMEAAAAAKDKLPPLKDKQAQEVLERIERRLAEYTQTPANASISNLVFVNVTIAPDAPPGRRELRLVTPRGITNPLVFCVGQAPEFTRKPMKTCTQQVLGKEEQALRKRPPEEEEVAVTVPCTANGQIAPGEINKYRFQARKGQRLLISILARQLNPYIADAVPGWFQPVLSLRNAAGKEVAFCDDYRFKPDPVLMFEVPEDGAYVLHVTDAIFRGREDFVYRLTIGELPFITSVFPLGGRAGEEVNFQATGWNLAKAAFSFPPKDAAPGVHALWATVGGLVSNAVPVAIDTLPEVFEVEPNNTPAKAQKVTMPVIINGRIDRRDDWDVFQITGRADEVVVAEVSARRLESPLDSVLRLTDAKGATLAAGDDCEDPCAGTNTHHADSYVMFKLPADGTYYVHLGDAARAGGQEYAYRLRLSPPRPDFTLFVIPSSLAVRSKSTTSVEVRVVRKDGFTGPVAVALKDPPAGFTLTGGPIAEGQTTAKLTLTTTLATTAEPVSLRFIGKAKTDQGEIVREAVGVEDRMQAFLWRHLVPAEDLKVLVYDPNYTAPLKRVRVASAAPTGSAAPAAPAGQAVASAQAAATKPPADAKSSSATPPKPTFTKSQVASLLRQLKYLYSEGLLTDSFYDRKVAECEAAQ